MYRLLFWLVLRHLPAELAHSVGFAGLRIFFKIPGARLLAKQWLCQPRANLRTQFLSGTLPNPIGLAAGFDKDGVAILPLSYLGFGFVEVGTVTAQAQPGNPKPRLFRLVQDRAIVNRMGFNNHGAQELARRLQKLQNHKDRSSIFLGVNIGKTKIVSEEDAISDYVASTEYLAPYADYLVINVSSPNTPGLRNLQAVEKLRPLIAGVQMAIAKARNGKDPTPLFLKIAPDLADQEIDDIVDLAVELGLSGLIATNTTISREGLHSAPEKVSAIGAGGLSGQPLANRSLAVLRRISARSAGRLLLISVGGIATAEDVRERLASGAQLVQIYTSFIYEGPFLPSRLAKQVAKPA